MRKKLIAFLVLVVVLGGFGGFYYVQGLAQAYRGVEFNVKDAEISLKGDHAELYLTVSLHNPSSMDLDIPPVDFEVSFNNHHLCHGILDPTHLPAGGIETSELTLSFSYSDLTPDVVDFLVSRLMEGGTVELDVDGAAHARLYFIPIDLAFHRKVDVGTRFEKPVVKSITHSWGTVSDDRIEIKTEVVVENPNPVTASIGKTVGVDFKLSINDIPMAEGRKTGVELKEEDFIIKFTTEFDLTKVQEWWVSHLRNGERSHVKIKAKVFLETGSLRMILYEKTMTREIETDIPSKIELKEPKDFWVANRFHVTIKDISSSWGEVNYEHTKINCIATIHNPNRFPIPVPRFSYTIKLNDVIVGEGSISSTTILKRKVDTQLPLTVTIDNYKLDDWIVTHIQNGESSILWIEITPEITFRGETYSINLLSRTITKAITTDFLNRGLTDPT